MGGFLVQVWRKTFIRARHVVRAVKDDAFYGGDPCRLKYVSRSGDVVMSNRVPRRFDLGVSGEVKGVFRLHLGKKARHRALVTDVER